MSKMTEDKRKKKASGFMQKVIAEEARKFLEENREVILKRAEVRLKKMTEILK